MGRMNGSPFGTGPGGEDPWDVAEDIWNLGDRREESISDQELADLIEEEKSLCKRRITVMCICHMVSCIITGMVTVAAGIIIGSRGGLLLGIAMTAVGLMEVAWYKGWLSGDWTGRILIMTGIILEAVGMVLGESITAEGITLILVGVLIAAAGRKIFSRKNLSGICLAGGVVLAFSGILSGAGGQAAFSALTVIYLSFFMLRDAEAP